MIGIKQLLHFVTGKIDRKRRGDRGYRFCSRKENIIIKRITVFPKDDKFVFGDIFLKLILCELNILKIPLWGPAKPKGRSGGR